MVVSEGWLEDDYLILFDDVQAVTMSEAYGLADFLPDYQIIGLRGWDDFILRNSKGQNFTVPTVPIAPSHIKPFELDLRRSLERDDRFTGRIKWHVKPLVFGGDPTAADNLTWVDSTQHAQLVRWWNTKYREVKPGV